MFVGESLMEMGQCLHESPAQISLNALVQLLPPSGGFLHRLHVAFSWQNVDAMPQTMSESNKKMRGPRQRKRAASWNCHTFLSGKLSLLYMVTHLTWSSPPGPGGLKLSFLWVMKRATGILGLEFRFWEL